MEIPTAKKDQQRVVVVGAGFAGLHLAKKLSGKHFQVVLIDKNNYHQFQPLLYQVAAAGLEPSSICFPLRKIFHDRNNVIIRIAEVLSVDIKNKWVDTSIGSLNYDHLVLANGASTNYFGMNDLQQNAYSMKSVSEALLLRNTLLQHYERALISMSEEERAALLNIVVVGGGPTGVELAGAIAEMKKKILPLDYPELNFGKMNVFLVEAAPRLLGGMSVVSASKVRDYLNDLGVHIFSNISVKQYDGHTVQLSDGAILHSRCLIWAAGIKGAALNGIPESSVMKNNGRLIVDTYNRVKDLDDIYAIGDNSIMLTDEYKKGHPQIAPVAIQQAGRLAVNLGNIFLGNPLKPFKYYDKGSMATVGRNLAVAELRQFKLSGFIAWFAWMAVHLMSIIGAKNKVLILVNWIWQYITYDQSLRLIIHPTERGQKKEIIREVPG